MPIHKTACLTVFSFPTTPATYSAGLSTLRPIPQRLPALLLLDFQLWGLDCAMPLLPISAVLLEPPIIRGHHLALEVVHFREATPRSPRSNSALGLVRVFNLRTSPRLTSTSPVQQKHGGTILPEHSSVLTC